ncbi:MAG: PP2C family protein-serine/threonine phosphatase, partial [Ignavibacteriaceae bacterium]
NAYHRKQHDSAWKAVAPIGDTDPADLNYLKDFNTLHVEYFSNQKFDVLVVLPLSDKSFMAILIGPKLDKSGFSDLDKITLQILLQVFDSAHKSFLNQKKEKALIFELNEKVVQLNNLIDTVIEVSQYDKRQVIYDLALERITSLTNASSALLQISENDTVKQKFSFPVNADAEVIMNSEFRVECGFTYNSLKYRFILAEKETRNGYTHFNDLDKMLLDAISRQVKATIKNQFLTEQAIEKEKIEQELNVAASIQQKIIPVSLPKIEGYDLAGINIPSREVGGDYYDCIELGNNKHAFIIADVAGKGIGAALLVSTLNAALYSYLQFDIPLTEIANRLNKLIYNSSPPDKYITFFIAVLNSATGELDAVNAGHNPVFLLRKNGTLEKIDAGGVGLGMFDFGIPFEGQQLVMNSGDRLFLYTDGIPEAMNDADEEYSDDKMIQFFTNNSGKSAKTFVDDLVKDVKEYTGNTPQSDDITVLILHRD